MSITLTFVQNKTPLYLQDGLSKFILQIPRFVQIKHKINIRVYHVPLFQIGGQYGFAFFDTICGKPFVYLSTDLQAKLFNVKLTRKDKLRIIYEDVVHEIVHYEQWRDSRNLNERNVQRRAISLTNKILSQTRGKLL